MNRDPVRRKLWSSRSSRLKIHTLLHLFAELANYATSRTLIGPSVSRRTVKGNSAVVVIGVVRRGVGGDDGARLR
jgi:hypothetical protein